MYESIDKEKYYLTHVFVIEAEPLISRQCNGAHNLFYTEKSEYR